MSAKHPRVDVDAGSFGFGSKRRTSRFHHQHKKKLMIPLKIRFTGLEFDPMDLLQSRQLRDSPVPEEWTRIRFEADFEKETDICKIEDWLARNTDGKWSVYCFSTGSTSKRRYNRTIVVAFELDVDAVMFRLKSGEVAWNEEQTEF